MTFGILEPFNGFQPTSTCTLQTITTTGSNDLMLIPQPLRSPLDPLNWSRVRKEMLFATIIFGSCVTGSLGPVLVPGFSVVADDLDVSLTSVTLLNGSLVMALGVSAYLCSAFSSVYGKRIVYLFTVILLLVSCCWAAASKSYNSLIASRVFQGLGMGGFFALAGTNSINDIFFLHERGLRVGMWNFGIIASVNLTPVISGYVISSLSWRWSYWLEVILCGLLLVAVLLFFPETSFHREALMTEPTPLTFDSEKEKGEIVAVTDQAMNRSRSASSSLVMFLLGDSSLRPPVPHNLLVACVKPLAILPHPIVLWECAMWAVVFTWTILLGSVASQIFTAPPFNMSTVAVGTLTGVAPFIGSALGTAAGGWLCDFSGKALSKRNNGVYEPEFRLFVMPLAIVAMAVGTFGLGATIQHGTSPVVCGVIMAILNFAVGVGCTGIVAYTNDVCAEKAGDAFGVAMVIKSAFAFGLTFVFNDYLTRTGPLIFFSTFGAVTVGVMLTTLPLYVFGKRIRAWSEEHNLLGRRG